MMDLCQQACHATSMKEFGPPSSFNTERYNKLLSTVHQFYSCRCEAFNSKMRNYNVYSNKAASSRDIALSFAVLEDILKGEGILPGGRGIVTTSVPFVSTALQSMADMPVKKKRRGSPERKLF